MSKEIFVMKRRAGIEYQIPVWNLGGYIETPLENTVTKSSSKLDNILSVVVIVALVVGTYSLLNNIASHKESIAKPISCNDVVEYQDGSLVCEVDINKPMFQET